MPSPRITKCGQYRKESYMKMRRAGIIITLCLTIETATITYGSVEDDAREFIDSENFE
jgi:hypothetical protein